MRHINLAGIRTIQKNVTTSGTPVNLAGYYAATTIGFSAAVPTACTVTDSANNFLKMGFRTGDKLVVTGSASNDGEYEILTVAAGVITLVSTVRLTTEAAGASVVLTAKQGYPVADGVSVSIKAKAANTGIITLGPSAATALNTNTAYFSNYRLSAGQAVSVQTKNLSAIWMDTTVSGEGVEVIFEE